MLKFSPERKKRNPDPVRLSSRDDVEKVTVKMFVSAMSVLMRSGVLVDTDDPHN